MTVSCNNMTKLTHHIRENLNSDVFSDMELTHLFSKSNNQRYGLVKRAIDKNDIIHIRRGLYCLAEKHRRHLLHPFELAQKIYGPSYISFESALSYHGLIPEAVHAVTSASFKRSREFQTPLGNFSFLRVIAHPFLVGVQHEKNEQGVFYLATPLRALADYVSVYKKEWKGIYQLIHSLRIEEEELHTLNIQQFNELEEAFHNRRVLRFLKGMRKDLQL